MGIYLCFGGIATVSLQVGQLYGEIEKRPL